MINIGKMNKLVVSQITDQGFILTDDHTNSEVFLPTQLALGDIKLDQKLNVFVYVDANGSLVATSKVPYAEVGEYAVLTAINVKNFGAFFDLGIEKDLLVPNPEQKNDIYLDEKHLVRVCLDEVTEKLYGTTKIADYIDDSEFDICDGDRVKIQVAHETDLGYRVIINKKYIGMIYHNEIFTDVTIGEFYDATVKKIRVDRLVDVSLQKIGIRNLIDSKEIVLQFIKDSGGSTTITAKSSPEEISNAVGMSKKSFKAAIGMLYKDRKIVIKDNLIELVKK